MNKKLAIFAAVLLVIGIIGTTWSGILVMPSLINFGLEKEAEFKKENKLYQEKVNIDKLDISVDNINVTIKKSSSEDVRVTTRGNNEFYKYNVTLKDKTLVVKGERKYENKIKKIKNFDQLLNTSINSMFSHDYREIIIYVPNNVDINASSISSYLFVYDNVASNNITYKTSSGGFSRAITENKVNRLENLNLISNSNLHLSTKSILGVKNVNIESESLDISSENEDVFIDNIEEYIPENVNIKEKIGRNSNYDSEFYLYSNMPIAKFLDIEVPNSKVRLDIPVNKYKFNCDIKSKEVIEEFNNDEEYDNDSYDYEHSEEHSNKYRNTREIKGLLNKNLSNLEKEYTIKINSNSLEL
ncbi:DUF4097 family beta strand repeat-containing protein [Clostridioides difficile]|uniref:DUF4097 family beta strand repeat protein n=1 Tax=Clostridioides difficile TaxID=1496 RepID=A0A9P3TT14_CLODI|nr:DUF4097 family beta strand repeat-containing protein [Clostridioides difficile]AWH77017.1 hypothetical protein DDG61_07480 [Clostridioides difficile]AWH80783.1 hypothetical protein DDG63_07205 [Clostridioides difficile]AXU45890.1 hypothetical protein CDIF29627_01409 [Clostridioides difficile]AXU75050.1 hypothetical protein CDIF28670_01450 [Clostridioides difficile]EGT2213711.1 DUF4097 family beta strand repeat protein [Clostridioides difficile]